MEILTPLHHVIQFLPQKSTSLILKGRVGLGRAIAATLASSTLSRGCWPTLSPRRLGGLQAIRKTAHQPTAHRLLTETTCILRMPAAVRIAEPELVCSKMLTGTACLLVTTAAIIAEIYHRMVPGIEHPFQTPTTLLDLTEQRPGSRKYHLCLWYQRQTRVTRPSCAYTISRADVPEEAAVLLLTVSQSCAGSPNSR